jgi:hypothetical protein
MCEACSAGANSVKCGGGAHKLRGRFFHASCTVTNARSHSKLTRHAPSTTCACSITPPPPPHPHMLTHINTCMHTQAHTHVHTRTHKHTHSLSLSLSIYLFLSLTLTLTHTHTHTHTHIYTHIHTMCAQAMRPMDEAAAGSIILPVARALEACHKYVLSVFVVVRVYAVCVVFVVVSVCCVL